MAGDRTLKLTLLAETKQLIDGLAKGAKSTESFGKQIGDISAKVVKSFALIGTAIAGVSLAFAKAAAEDQQAANKLNLTLQSVTDATNKQIAAVGNYITKTSVATGITDDELRPAMERLARSTGDVEKSQTLLNLALDLSAATGKPLESVTNALAKAYDGSYTSLQRLGLGIDANLIKAKDFDGIYRQLNGTFGEFSERRSEEALVKFQRLQVAVQEAKEAVGAALLPVFQRLGDWLLNEGVPRLNAFVAGLTGDKSLSYSFGVAEKESEKFGQKVRSVIDTVVEYKDVIIAAAAVTGTIFAVSKIAAGVTATVAAIKTLIAAYNALKASAIVAGVATAFALNPLLGLGAVALGASVLAAAAAISRNSDVSFEDIAGGGVGLGNRPLGGVASLGGSGGGGGGIGSFGGGGGGGNGGGSSTVSTGASSSKLTGIPLLDALKKLDRDLKRTNKDLKSGKISPFEANQLLDQFLNQRAELLGEAVDAGAIQAPLASISGGTARGEYGATGNTPIVINVNAPSVIDETGFARAVQRAIQSSEDRGTYTGGL